MLEEKPGTKRLRTKTSLALVILLVLVAYVALLLRNLNESERRSLHLNSGTQTANEVLVFTRIVNVDTNLGEMTARIRVQLAGSIAMDEVTPSADLKLFLNSSRGTQEIEFPKGRRLSPIEAVFLLDGNVNKYPFDSYESRIGVLMTKSNRTQQAQVQPGIDAQQTTEPTNGFDQLLVGSIAQKSEPVPIRLELLASVPRIKFRGKIVEIPGEGVTAIDLKLTRADHVIALSLLVMVLMMSLAISVFLMAVRVVTSDHNFDLLPLSLSISLIFGLPALRNNAQPGVPPVGVISDYVSFIWAENIVGISAVMIMLTWLRRSLRSKGQKVQ